MAPGISDSSYKDKQKVVLSLKSLLLQLGGNAFYSKANDTQCVTQ
jgi:hypothetical protein